MNNPAVSAADELPYHHLHNALRNRRKKYSSVPLELHANEWVNENSVKLFNKTRVVQ